MIERMCPEGVERVRLDSVCSFQRGKTITAKDAIDGSIPVIAGGQTPSYYHNEANKCGESVVVAGSGAYAGFVSYWNIPIYVSDAFSVEPQGMLMHKYLFFYLKQNQKKIFETQKGAGVPHVHGKDIAGFLISLPPLPIQQEIVRVLDTFTQLQSNLEVELVARQKQYEYYRNKLLTFDKDDESVEWKTLGEIGTIYKGKGIQKADFTDVGKPCIHYGQVHTFYGSSATETKSFISEELYSSSNKAIFGDIIIATTSEDVEACCKSTVWLGDGEPAISGDAHYYRHNQNPKYMGYLFMTEMFAVQKRIAAVGAKVTRVHGDSIMKFKFPFPSLQRQQEIVSILDTFESLITNLKQEIEARKKQYEYYREQLLTF